MKWSYRLFMVISVTVISLSFSAEHTLAQTVTPATGGASISADNFGTTWTTLTGPVIQETAPGQLTPGQIRFQTPTGFIFDSGGTAPTITVTSPKSGKITVTVSSRTSTEIIFNVTGSSSGNPKNNPHRLEFANIRVRPSQGTPLATGNISNAGSAAPGGTTNYGTLTMVAGANAKIRVETAAGGGGSVVGAQSVEAGSSLNVFAVIRDQYNNYKSNATSPTWSLQNITGGVLSGNLSPSGGSATFNADKVGSANIRATSGALTAVSSGTVSVVPGDAASISIATQPSVTLTAGNNFATQPVLHVLDANGNIVTDDDFTQVTAARGSGSGTLLGTTTRTATSGIVTFTNLSFTTAGTIDIDFTSSGFTTQTSNTITVSPAAADNLDFVVQPTNSNRNQAVVPAVEVQIFDTYGNVVSQSGTTVTLNMVSGSGSISGNAETTDAGGKATFPSLQFNQTGLKSVQATASGLTSSPVSNTFTVSNAGTLAGFVVEQPDTNPIGTQEAGVAFNIRIAAVDGVGDTLDGNQGRDNFTGFVDLTTSSVFSGSTTTSNIGPFVDGIYSPHTVNLTQSGSGVTITATNASGSESGSSNSFTVDPDGADPGNSTISVSESTLIADGVSTSAITVQLVDNFGNQLNTGGDTVVISIASGTGSISSTTDNGDGTYSATLTAPNDVGSATIQATVNSTLITSSSPVITFTYDVLSTFQVEASGGGNIGTQTAGTSFTITITALDAYNNVVADFNGGSNTVEITSNQTISSGGGTSPAFSNGILSAHSITITSAGSTTITARKSASSETGSSNSFTVNPASADPASSTITAGQSFLENNGADTTPVTVQLIDAFGNNLITGGVTVTLNTTAGSLGSITDNSDGTYTATLTSGSVTATATITGTVNSSSITDNAVVEITEFNEWEGDAKGNASGKDDWDDPDNWSLNSLPTTGQVVYIPTGLTYYPKIENLNPTIDFLSIESGATVTLNNSRTLTINNEISGAGSFTGNTATVNLKGNSSVQNFIAGSSTINLNGTTTQTISNDFTANFLNVQNNVNVTGYFEAFNDLTIDAGKTLTMSSGSQLVIFGDIYINGTLTGNSSAFSFGGAINGSNINLNNTSVTLNGTTEQQISGITEMSDLIIDNSAGVVLNNDLEITGTLTFTSGTLTVENGYSLVSNTKAGNTSDLIIKRTITGSSGWRTIASPLQSTFGDFLDGTVTQGYPGAFYPTGSNPGDTVQPNVLYYLESFSGLDNERYRAPSSASSSMTPGQGLFVYFFGSVAGDSRYNNPLPDTLIVSGEENSVVSSQFTFPVTYTASADTGWNLVGNPFTATIDWDDGNWTKTNMDNSLYVWDPGSSDYLTWNGTTGSLGDGTIKPFQAFWVKANGNGAPTLKVNQASKTTGGTFYKERKDTVNMKITLKADTLEKSTYLSFVKGGKYGKDRYDAYRLKPFGTNTYLEVHSLLEDGTELSINNLPRDFGLPIEIPLYFGGFNSGKAIESNMELSWGGLDKLPAGWTVSLIDKNRNKSSGETDMREVSSQIIRPQQLDSLNRDHHPAAMKKMIKVSPQKVNNARYILRIDPGEDANGLPDKFRLYQNYPNPFNPETNISFDLPLSSPTRLEIFDVLGRKVQTLVSGELSAGTHTVKVNLNELSSGVYLYRLKAGEAVFSKKMMLIK